MALYNEVRPQTLSELKGQEDVVKIIRKSVAGKTLPNAMLFTGTRGTGKTTVARIVAKMVNCENPRENGDPCCECPTCVSIREGKSLDVIELDAASNNGVDDVRKIIELVQYECLSNKRVVILDEAHMLSKEAFNALLKVLEEPPKSAMFILCTTELQKVPATILSRCRKFQFKSLSLAEITSKLSKIASDRNKTAEDGALTLVAKAAKGSMRDAESIFESFLEMDEITEDGVRRVLGFSSEERIVNILEAVADRQPMIVRDGIMDAADAGESLNMFIEDMIEVLVRLSSVQLDGDITGISPEVAQLSQKFTTEQVFELIGALKKTYEAKPDNMPVSLVACLVGQTCREEKIAKLEREIAELKACGVVVSHEEKPAAEKPSQNDGDGAAPDDGDWDRFMSLAEYEDADNVPFEAELVASEGSGAEASAKASVSDAPVDKKPVLSKETLSSLEAAGFVVEGVEGDVPEPVHEEKKVEKAEKKSEEVDLMTQFKNLFTF
ncbi:MAG: DNA polymerase III subunit gamma/tau [Lachnospiraceae bacterium]|nr:DNA polymerase III subunit gamma/tau [Lachnospiraceae bacterium]